MKTVIALRGPATAGKTTTLRNVYGILRQKNPNAKVEYLKGRADIRVVLTIAGVKIGIESQGDPNSRQAASVALFVNLDCEVIVCATRTKGETVEAVRELEATGYEIMWHERFRAGSSSEYETNNRETAMLIVAEVESIVDALSLLSV